MNRGQAKLYTIASGKGGVGKTSMTLNLAASAAHLGKRVLVVDGDTGLANADVQLNIRPEFDLAYALTAQKPLADIITPTPHRFDLIAGRAGHTGLAGLLLPTLSNWLNELRALTTYDIILLDAAAGISPHTLLMCAQSTSTLLLTTPDPSSLTDAYALLKMLWQQHNCSNAQLIVNQATPREGALVHKRLTTAAEQFLKIQPLPLMGSIPSCKYYSQAIKNHQLAFAAFPHSPALQEVRNLAKAL